MNIVNTVTSCVFSALCVMIHSPERRLWLKIMWKENGVDIRKWEPVCCSLCVPSVFSWQMPFFSYWPCYLYMYNLYSRVKNTEFGYVKMFADVCVITESETYWMTSLNTRSEFVGSLNLDIKPYKFMILRHTKEKIFSAVTLDLICCISNPTPCKSLNLRFTFLESIKFIDLTVSGNLYISWDTFQTATIDGEYGMCSW